MASQGRQVYLLSVDKSHTRLSRVGVRGHVVMFCHLLVLVVFLLCGILCFSSLCMTFGSIFKNIMHHVVLVEEVVLQVEEPDPVEVAISS